MRHVCAPRHGFSDSPFIVIWETTRACPLTCRHCRAEADRPLYEDVRERGLDFARIRIVQPPLTDYLRYELASYRIRSEMGESVEVVPASPERVLPDEDHFDFLLFDQETALVHDYGKGPVGVQTGGWVVGESAVLRRLEARALELRARAEPLDRFLEAARL